MTINNTIPAGWRKLRLGDICSFYSGGTPSKNNPKYWNNGTIKWLSAKYIENNKVIGWDLITDEGLYACKIANKDDIILVTRVSIGKLLLCNEPFAVNQDLTIIKTNKVNNLFLFNVLQQKNREIIDKSQGLAIKGITKESLADILFLLPPLSEQEKIAEILGTWNEAIEKVSDLIEQKKLLKKGLMQKLLTGKTRLSGFTQPWKTVKLDEICNIKKGQQLNKLDMKENANYPVLNGGIDFSGYTTEYNTKANTITISEGGNSCGFINFIKQDFWAGGHCYVIDNIQISKEFLFQSLKLKETKIMHLRVGSGLPNIQLPSLKKYKITIPSDIAEQKAIADILQSCDLEIEKLKTKLDLLKLQKKGLMQQLLTGKIRVKVNK